MRQIAFRAWDASEKEMVCWPVLYNDPDDWLIDLCIGRCQEGDALMQFTGLLDLDGKEIYEGDIVDVYPRFEGGPEGRETIIYMDGAFGFGEVGGGSSWDYYENEMGYHGMRVIGNMYENPELDIKN